MSDGRWMGRAARCFGWALVLAVAKPAAHAAAPAEPAPAASTSSPADPARLERGRQVYNARCYFCHGYSGDARTLAATYLNPPPRDFTRPSAGPGAAVLDEARILDAVRHGRPGTAMQPFASLLDAAAQGDVAHFVAEAFVRRQVPNTAYHTEANGWPDHTRHAAAFPFARGELALDAPDDTLSAEQLAGRRLYRRACISCHDRGRVDDAGPVWGSRPLSYPRIGIGPGALPAPPHDAVDAVSSASVYGKHEVAPRIAGLTRTERRGERLFQANCAFCHGADGSGQNWIGRFMEPPARDLRQLDHSLRGAALRQRIAEGLPGTSMPAWRGVLSRIDIDAIGHYVERALISQPARAAPGTAR
jgi:cytochrome c oxidase cbb3-type subunit III